MSQVPSWHLHHTAIIENSDDAIVSKNLDGIVQSWNIAAERMFGFTAAEMIGQSITKIIPQDRLTEEPVILGKMRMGERIDHFETVRQRKDGTLIDVSVTISPIRDLDGTIVGVSKIARDITAAKRTARERDRLYALGKAMAGDFNIESIVQSFTDAATELAGAQFGAFFYNVVDDSGESYKLYTISGVSREEFARFPMPRNTEVFGPTFSGAGIVRSPDITKDPRYGKNPPYHGMPEGHLPVRSYLAVPVFSRDRRVIGGLFFGHSSPGVFDEQAEAVVSAIAGHAGVALENATLHAQVKENMQRFQQLANTIPQLAWMARDNGAAFWFNQRWYEFTGASPDTPSPGGWEQFVDPAQAARVAQKWTRAIHSGEPWEDTFPLRRADGVYRQFLSRAHAFRDHAGKIIMWFGTHTDVSDQQQLMREREELLNAERAARAEIERISRLKDEFLATLSHELRTPLNAILGWSQLIRNTAADPATVAEGLDVIERNARVQTQLIEDLLDMSRIISGKIRLDVQRVELSQVVNAAIESVKPAADSRNIRLHSVLDPHAGPVAGDPGRLQQVVWNLLSNAIKFTPKNGKVTILLERVNSHIELTVNDTGEGIDPEFLPHVFDRFRQADSTTTRRHGGLGLGLAIVKQLTELHGGTVRVKSPGKGQGATFTVAIPVLVATDDSDRRHPRGQSGHGPPDAAAPLLAGVRVLVVEDEPDARDLIRRILVNHQAHVSLAASADEGLQVLQNQPIDALISDIGMPGKDGYEFIREVRRLPPDKGGKTPAIALSAFARSEDRTRALMAGYQVHLAKPVEGPELLATVASVAGRNL
ncbi:MAG TPA: PAS domain S-box protein [Phycisphaerae bacterium]|nr:PAS domain S-box protein [Phycisphaerae bacterium]